MPNVNKLADLMTLERSDGNALILSVSEFEAKDGAKPKFISIGLHGQKDDGTWQDLRKGCTIRRGEIRKLVEALIRAEEMIDEGRIDQIALSHAEYAKVFDFGGPGVPCLSQDEMPALVEKCRRFVSEGWAEDNGSPE